MKKTDKVISSIRKSCTQTILSIGVPRFNRKDRAVTQEVNSSKNATSYAGSYTKKLIHTESGPYHKLNQIVNETRTFHEENTSPTKIHGVRLLAAKNYMDYTEGIRERKAQFEELKEEFLGNYETYIDESKKFLGDMFDIDEYPHPNEVRDRFKFDTSCCALPDTDNVEVYVSGEELLKIKEQMHSELLDNVNANQKALWESMYNTINYMADKCSKEIGEKGSVFVDKEGKGMIQGLANLCTLIPKKDILGDPDLEAIRKEVEEKLLVSPKDLREDPTKREKVADEAKQILDSMTSIMGYTPEARADVLARKEEERQSWSETVNSSVEVPSDGIVTEENEVESEHQAEQGVGIAYNRPDSIAERFKDFV
tara:strand:+ start:110 stop:1216 length:1107 start_codon:yes stop_codon:yes gene_type:complete